MAPLSSILTHHGRHKSTKKTVAIGKKDEVIVFDRVDASEDHLVAWLDHYHSPNKENKSHFQTVAAARRAESLMRCQIHHQWHLCIENYSKVRKRQSNSTSTADTEAQSHNNSGFSEGVNSVINGSVSSLNHSLDQGSMAHLSKEDEWSIDFGSKPGLWRKTVRSFLLRLRGQEQHKDVYVMPAHLRNQLKQMYVY